MKTLSQVQDDTRSSKRLIVLGLFLIAGAITLSGTFFMIYSYLNNVYFKVMNSNVSGIVFGLIVVYFGIRSIFSVNKLRPQLYKNDVRFSWDNFKKQKTAKKQKTIKKK